MQLHSNAALTIAQRQQVRQLFQSGQGSLAQLARRFSVSPRTIARWARRETPHDQKAPVRAKRVVTPQVVTPQYEAAVVAYRKQNPQHGAIRIALALQEEFPQAHRGTVAALLQKHRLTTRRLARPKTKWQIPVGRHRLQMDVQQLPAIEGSGGFEYKISLIHLKTRWKYSEIHPDCQSQTVAGVYERALDTLPPFLSSSPTTPATSPCATPPTQSAKPASPKPSRRAAEPMR
jgi:transposase-like protein